VREEPLSETQFGPAAELLALVTASLDGGGEERPGQRAMAEAVELALVEHRHLVVQAGTGTGKSLAYLVPAARAGRPVIVATATKALQEQLASRDLPQVAAALGDLSFAVLKGRSNYACRQKIAELDDRGFQASFDDSGAASDQRLVGQVRRLLAWAQTAASGDRAELGDEVSDRAWSMVSTAPRECPGAFSCPEGARCFTELARQRAAESDVVVVNLHLLGADLASAGAVLPEHDLVIIDEAHELEAVMTQALGVDLSPGRLRTLASSSRSLLAASGADASATLSDAAEALAALLGQREGASRVELGSDEALSLALTRLDSALRAVLSALRSEEVAAQPAAPRALSLATRLVEELASIRAAGDGDVLWIGGSSTAPMLVLSPIDVGPALRSRLFDQATVVLTSATIPPRLVERLGIADAAVDEIDVGSPFDFRTQSLLYVATDIGDRRDPEAEDRIADELVELIEAAGGRTLALFTSRRALSAVSSLVAGRSELPILVQGSAANRALVDRFRDEEHACLFATMGMWQGLDVPGRSLSLVTIDRLPFGRPDDPVLEARRAAAGSRAFAVVDLPRAATLLAQGAGRLIRSISDEGVVAVFDSRLATAGYRSALLDALPPMRRTLDRDEVLAFLAGIAADDAQ